MGKRDSLPEICPECRPECADPRKYGFKFCKDHTPNMQGPEDAAVFKLLEEQSYSGVVNTDADTYRAWAEWQRGLKEKPALKPTERRSAS